MDTNIMNNVTSCCNTSKHQSLQTPKALKQRKKIWEIPSYYFCSLIGTCASTEELRVIYKKLKYDQNVLKSDYHLHKVFVASASEATSSLSKILQKNLDKKFRDKIRLYARAESSEQMRKLWDQAVAAGDISGDYWVMLTNPLASVELCDHAYGEVHMLSHLSGAKSRRVSNSLEEARSETRVLQHRLDESTAGLRSTLKSKERLIDKLKQCLEDATETNNLQKQQLDQLLESTDPKLLLKLREEAENLSVQLTAERDRKEQLKNELTSSREQQAMAQDQNRVAHTQISSLRQELLIAEQRLQEPRACLVEAESVDEDSDLMEDLQSMADLSGRCILYVGGRAKQCKHFRDMVTERNGEFIYHDGGLEDTNIRLDAILRRADAVLCPMNCISHNAVKKAKRYCKQSATPLIMMPHASLQAFSHGLDQVIEQ